MRLVLIEWIDAYGCSTEWQTLSEIDTKVLQCRSVGWLLHDGEECKVIIPHITNSLKDDQGCGDMTIPVSAITRIADLVVISDLVEVQAETTT